ncbi:hypothetical protein Calab_3163 [Caldithrix abyssi DSM 13497]|uniref:Tubulin like n=1 Tax=Caldithrix abyssi DSM 13497 TaxID=880073 RepID=H1XUE3_CALAY|nr:tubulin-like doman-containing protein [Caldithrix abyssi]APF18791.1 Tubulin like [Caldithrix abyssi DSM 13497]EHO42769.1 hypothetical protein Calab_3163 [Caldithrix abyssi DSM 13497]
MNAQYKIPTILLGIGGTGGRIVDQLAGMYYRLEEEHRNNIPTEFLVLDTDVNDINRIKHIEPQKVFRISRNYSIKQYIELHNNGRDIEGWFPILYQYLHNKSVLEGAGQIRILGRLALYAMFEQPGFEERVASEIRNTLRQWHGQLGNLRIFLIGSICGGTASGILIPLTLWLHKEFNALHPQIKGVFFLPGIYTNAYNLPINQHERLRVNAYAALKEIENMFRFIYGLYDRDQNGLKPRPLHFDFHPQYRNFQITSNQQLFKMVYLVDFENMKNQHLVKRGEEYENLVIHGIFNQLYTPIASAQGSIEDNNIIQTLQTLGKQKLTNIYCTFGVAAVEYPYDDLLNYLAHQYSIRTISENWLKIDREFEARKKNYDMQRQQGILNLPELRLEKEYVSIFESFSQNDTFFNTISKRFNIQVEGTNLTVNQADHYIEALEKHLLNELRTNELYFNFAYKYARGIDAETLKEEADPADAIATFEQDFEEMRLKLNRPGDQVSDMVFRQSVLVGEETPDGQLLEIHLQNYIRKDSPHPIGVRYFLYKVMLNLESKIENIEKELLQLNDQFNWYQYKAFDDPETEEIENATMRFDRIRNSGLIKRMLKINKFLENYSNEASNHIHHLKKYMEEYALLKLFKRIYEEVDNIVEEYETFFDSLPTLIHLVQVKISELENMHDARQKNSFKHYIFASAELKRKLWEQEKFRLTTFNDPKINHEIYELLFKTYYNRYRSSFTLSRRRKIHSTYPHKFIDILIPRCVDVVRSSIGGNYNLNFAEIFRKRIELENPDMEPQEIERLYIQEIKMLLKSLFNRAEGFLQVVDDRNIQTMIFLGIHEDVLNYLRNTINDFDAFIQQEAGQQTISDNFFNNRIIQAYRVRYGITAKDMARFHFKDGEYYRAYQKCIKNIFQSDDPEVFPNDVLPHLDKNWHKYGYLPGIFEEEIDLYNRMKMTAITAGRLTDTINIQKSHRAQNEIIVRWQWPGELLQESFMKKISPSTFCMIHYWLDDHAGYIPRFLDEFKNWVFNSNTYDEKISHFLRVWKELMKSLQEERGNLDNQTFIYNLAKQLLPMYKYLVMNQEGISDDEKFKQFNAGLQKFSDLLNKNTKLHQDEKNNLTNMIESVNTADVKELETILTQSEILL